MQLGAFSVSLTVNDIQASKTFYETLGFQVIGGQASDHWLIMRNGDHTIGLFQGMFDKNLMTFNPGWDKDNKKLESFTDIREIQKELKQQGIPFEREADEETTGPTSFVVIDPDGNPILVDQHV